MPRISFYKDNNTEISVDEKKHGEYYIVTIKTNLDKDPNINFSDNSHLKTVGCLTTKKFGFNSEDNLDVIKSEVRKITEGIYRNDERKLKKNLKRVDKTAKGVYKIFNFHKNYAMKHPELEKYIYIYYAIPVNKEEETI